MDKATKRDLAFVDLRAQYARLSDNIGDRIQTVLEHGRFIAGPEVSDLEQRLAEFSGVGHAVAVSSGTDALLATLMAWDVGVGDAVFVPSFTFTASAEVILMTGATPVFVDVDADTFNIDPVDLRRRIEKVVADDRLTPRAVIAVDLYGMPADYKEIEVIAAEHDLFLLADAAQSFGGAMNNVRVGALAPVTAVSFFPAKPLGCYGDGGAVLTDDGELADRLRSIRAHGKGGDKYDIVRVGLNARLDTMQAAILLAKLDVFEDELAAREDLARRYDRRLGDIADIPSRPAGLTSAWAQYTLKLDHRDAVAAALKAAGIPTAIYYPMPMHLQTAYREYGEGMGSIPVAESLCPRVLSLPMHPYMEAEEADYICNHLASAIETAGS